MNCMLLRKCLLLLVIALPLITLTLEAAQSESEASAQLERVSRKIKTPNGKKIVRQIRVIEPDSSKVVGPKNPQTSTSNKVNVSPEINIKMPQGPAYHEPLAIVPVNQRPKVDNNHSNDVPTSSDKHLPQDLKSPNTKIRQVEYRPRKRPTKIEQTPSPAKPKIEYYVDEPDDNDQEATEPILETPGLPGVPVIIPKSDEPELKATSLGEQEDDEEVITVQVPKELPTKDSNLHVTLKPSDIVSDKKPILDIVPAHLNRPSYNILPIHSKILPVDYNLSNITPFNMLPTPSMLPNYNMANNMVPNTNREPNVVSDIGNNKSVNMSNMGNHNSTFIGGSTNSQPSLILNNVPQSMSRSPAPDVPQADAPPKPKRRAVRKSKDKLDVQSIAPVAQQQDPSRLVVPPIFIQYNQMPNQQSASPIPISIPIPISPPMVSQGSPPVFVSAPSPINSFSSPPPPPMSYNMSPIQYVNRPIVSAAGGPQPNLMMPPNSVQPDQQASMPAYWGPYGGYRQPMVPFPLMKYPYPPMPFVRSPNDYSFQMKPGQPYPYYYPYPPSRMMAPMVQPIPFPQYPLPYGPYPVPVSLPLPFPMMIPTPPVRHQSVEKVDVKKFEQKDHVKDQPKEKVEIKPQVQYIERQRVVPINYQEDPKVKIESIKSEPTKEDIEWTTIRVPKISGSASSAAAIDSHNSPTTIIPNIANITENMQPKFKTITERVPISSTITSSMSSVLPGTKSN